MERSRRSFLRLAAEVPASRATKAIVTRLGSAHKSSHEKWATCLVETPVVVVVVVVAAAAVVVVVVVVVVAVVVVVVVLLLFL